MSTKKQAKMLAARERYRRHAMRRKPQPPRDVSMPDIVTLRLSDRTFVQVPNGLVSRNQDSLELMPVRVRRRKVKFVNVAGEIVYKL